jgi:hypothetical protein
MPKSIYTENHRKIWIKHKGIHNSTIRYICPHCNKEGKGSVMKRWHFNNCKNKK